MSVTYRPDKPNETEELKKEVETVKAAGESTAALLSLFFQSADCRRPRRGNERDCR